jgi:hypothetical protein
MMQIEKKDKEVEDLMKKLESLEIRKSSETRDNTTDVKYQNCGKVGHTSVRCLTSQQKVNVNAEGIHFKDKITRHVNQVEE